MISQEEIEAGKVNIFEHVNDPLDLVDVKACMRLMNFFPLCEQYVMDILISKLTDRGLFKQLLKTKLKSLESLLNVITTQVYAQLGFRQDDGQDFESNQLFSAAMVEKIAASMVEYMGNIERLTNISGDLTETQRSNYILDNALMLYQLKPGDRFFFLDEHHACEYTFKKYQLNKSEIKVFIDKQSHELNFVEHNPFRPVIKSNLINEETYKSLETHYKRIFQWKQIKQLTNSRL